MPQFKQLAKQVWQKSWAKTWGFAKIGIGASLEGVHQVGKLVTDPGAKDLIDKLELPVYITAGLVVLGLITYMSAEHE